MAIWLDDLIEQIATSMVLSESGTETGKRLAFVIVDNAVEFLMKAYVESEARMVGPGKAISKQDWENKKRYFEQVLDFIYAQFAITASKTDILSYHDVRNKLYHEGKPLSVSPNTISKYTEQLKIMLNDLHRFRMNDDDWIKKAHDVSKMISREEVISSKAVIRYVKEDNKTRFETDSHLKDTVAIMHAINSFSNHNGSDPGIEEIENILARSSHPLEKGVIIKRLNHLRSSGKLLKSKNMLDPSAVRALKEKFAIIC